MRSFAKPRGFDALTGAEGRRCVLGNIFADFTWEVLELAVELDVAFTLLEQPEDGSDELRTSRRPATLIHMAPQLAKILCHPGYRIFSFHQGNLGAGYPKPNLFGC